MRCPSTLLALCVLSLSSLAQQGLEQQQKTTAATIVPRLVKFGGAVAAKSPGVVGITFALYKDQNGGAPLWLETQNVKVDGNGHYSILLGSTKPDGLPAELFTSGEAQWLGVRVENATEQPRVLLLSVPYALKASDAETLSGKPASAFVIAQPFSSIGTKNKIGRNTVTAALSGGGTANFLPLWTSSTDLGSSIVFQSSVNNLGVGTTSPAPNWT